MLIDITLQITPQIARDAQGNEKKALVGHLGTHFDVMNKTFPLRYTERQGIVFDVRDVEGRDIELSDIAPEHIHAGMFVAFCTGYIEKVGYGGAVYFREHPQLSTELIDTLLAKCVSLIGIDFAGIRRGREHTPTDQRCADHGTFIIENLCNLKEILEHGSAFIARTFPMNYADMTGLPCRVIAEVKDT